MAANRHFCAVELDYFISMANFVLVVPKQTLNALLVSWLNLSEVGKLDAALCDRACRDIFEHSLALRNFSGATDIQFDSTSFISWIIKRKVKLDTLLIENTLLRRLNEELRFQLLKIVGPSLRKVVISCGKEVRFDSAYFTDSIDRNTENASDKVKAFSDSGASSESFDSDSDSSSGIVRFIVPRVGRDSGSAQDVNHAVEMKLLDGAITDLTLRCTMLETITVLGHHSGSIVPLLQMNPKLSCVTLRNCSKVLRYVGNLCPNITSITIDEGASSIDLEQFACNIPMQLKRLCLPSTNVGKDFLETTLARASLLELRVNKVSCKWSSLTAVCRTMKVFRCIVPSGQMKTKLISRLAKIMPNLRTLILFKSTLQTHAINLLKTILASFPALRQLCNFRAFESKLSILRDGPPTTAQMNEAYTSGNFALEELYLDNTGNFSLHATLAKCPALHTLGLSSGLAEGSQYMKSLPMSVKKLFCASLCSYDIAAEGLDIFQNLDELDLGYCAQLTDSALICIAQQCPGLTLLHIMDAPKVTLQGVLALLKLCPQLRILEVKSYAANAANLRGKDENGALAAVMKLCRLLYPQLQHISL